MAAACMPKKHDGTVIQETSKIGQKYSTVLRAQEGISTAGRANERAQRGVRTNERSGASERGKWCKRTSAGRWNKLADQGEWPISNIPIPNGSGSLESSVDGLNEIRTNYTSHLDCVI